MDKEDKGYCSYPIHEYFKFGPGQPIPAVRGWNYNVGINGFNEEIQIAEIDADVPGLCGPDDMARWNMKLDFEDGTIQTHGRKTLIEPSQTSHPCICLFQFPKTEFYAINGDDEEEKVQKTRVAEFYDINSDDEKEKVKKARRRLRPPHESYPASIVKKGSCISK